MKAACHFVAIDCLAARIGKKVPVDIVGVVTNVTPLSSVKRTADGSEISRRCDPAAPSAVINSTVTMNLKIGS